MLFAASFEDKLAAFGMKCLTVAGGFVAGYVLGWVIAVAVNKWVFKKDRTPEGLKQVLRIVCGIVVALLVAVSIFGGDGGGTGTEGSGKATDTDQDANKSGTPVTSEPKDTKQPTPATITDPRPAEVTIRITVLGGTDVRDEKFYLIDDDRNAKTLAAVKAELTARKAKEPRKIIVALLPSERQQLPMEHVGWTQLVKTIKDEVKLAILLPESK